MIKEKTFFKMEGAENKMRTVEVRSNIAGDIMKIRKGVVFKEYATVIDELLQNCQRAKATYVEVECQGNMLKIVDDGVGCKDPQSLFEKNTSAWAEEDEAFGEGFFSVFLLADHIVARSHDWELSIDVLEMLRTKNMVIDVTDGLPVIDGFEVTVIGEKVSEQGYWLRNEVDVLGPIMPMKVVMNGSVIEEKPLLQVTTDLEMNIENDIFSAVLAPTTGYSTVEYFYENRPVRSDYVTGVKGRVAIKKGQITLKAPDRKEFIYDEKRRALVDKVAEEAKNMYREFIVTATDEELDTYEEAIQNYLEVEEYAKILNVSQKLFKRVLEEQLQEMFPVQDARVPKWVPVDRSVLPAPTHAMPKSEYERLQKPQREVGMLQKLAETEKMLVYVPSKSVEMYEKDIRRAEYLGFTIAYARNRLYEKAFDYYGVPSIDNMKDVVEEVCIVEREEPRNKKEKRFLSLMKRVEEFYGMKDGSIRLANLSKENKHKDTGETLSRSNEEVHGLCKRIEGLVYLDRRIVKFPEYRAQDPDYPTVTAHDYKVLMRVIQTLAHELAHLLYGFEDNTMEHSQATIKIGYELADLF